MQSVTIIKLNFFQYSPIVQLYTSADYYKITGNIAGSHFVQPFQLFCHSALRHILNGVKKFTELRPFNADIS